MQRSSLIAIWPPGRVYNIVLQQDSNFHDGLLLADFQQDNRSSIWTNRADRPSTTEHQGCELFGDAESHSRASGPATALFVGERFELLMHDKACLNPAFPTIKGLIKFDSLRMYLNASRPVRGG